MHGACCPLAPCTVWHCYKSWSDSSEGLHWCKLITAVSGQTTCLQSSNLCVQQESFRHRSCFICMAWVPCMMCRCVWRMHCKQSRYIFVSLHLQRARVVVQNVQVQVIVKLVAGNHSFTSHNTRATPVLARSWTMMSKLAIHGWRSHTTTDWYC